MLVINVRVYTNKAYSQILKIKHLFARKVFPQTFHFVPLKE